MSASTNKQLALQFCSDLSDRNMESMFELLSDDATWSGVGQPETFKYGGTRSKERSVEFIGGFLKAFDEFRFDVQGSTAEDDKVAIEATSRGVGASGNIYQNQYLILFRFADGKIVEIREFFDQIAVLKYEELEST